MAKSITQFFLDLGFPLRNSRWSWGALSSRGVLLRTWAHDLKLSERRVVVLSKPEEYLERDSYGLDERIRHLRALWAGGVAGYTVIATAKEGTEKREIKDYRDDSVFVIQRLEVRDDGAIVAVVGGLTKVSELATHLKDHQTQAAEGEFPVDVVASGISTDSYKDKLPALRSWLIDVARGRGYVTYSQVMDSFGLIFFVLRTAMSGIGHECVEKNEPILTALIVDKETLRCSVGFAEEFGVDDDQAERERCYSFWAANATPTDVSSIDECHVEGAAPDAGESLEERASRFAEVEIRIHQSAFRRAVFLACSGRCVVSGCDIPEALEAAHLKGRSWREGHNAASDGVLLRRDLHALYDRGLLSFSAEGRFEIDERARAHYHSLESASAGRVE